jgi:hypothetical protein
LSHEQVAREYSEDKARDGGNLGWMTRQQMWYGADGVKALCALFFTFIYYFLFLFIYLRSLTHW